MSLEGRSSFLSPVPPVSQPPAHTRVSPGKPPSLHHHSGWLQGAPHSSWGSCQAPWLFWSSPSPLTLLLQIEGALSSPRRDDFSLLPGCSIKVQQREQSKSAAHFCVGAARWDTLCTCRQQRANMSTRAGPPNSLFCRISLRFWSSVF